MKRIIVLGAGKKGRIAAIALSRKYDLSCSDYQLCTLEELSQNNAIAPLPCNVTDYAALKEVVHPFHLVVSCLPADLAYPTLKALILFGKNTLNLSELRGDMDILNDLAVENEVSVISLNADRENLEENTLDFAEALLNTRLTRKGLVQLHLQKESLTV